MPKVLANIIIIILVFILIALGIYPLFSGGKDTGNKASSEQGKIDRMIEDPASVSGSTVKQYMKIAAAKLPGLDENTILTAADTTLASAAPSLGTDAIDFVPSGNFATGQTYVIVNYWKVGSTRYTQATSQSDFKENAIFSVAKQYDVNGKLNRLTFTQVDMGK